MFFGFWELRLKRQLTDKAVQPLERACDRGILDDISENIKREQALGGLPKQELFKVRMVVMLKFLFVAILIAEVIVLQRPE
jgi:hypothetical protein